MTDQFELFGARTGNSLRAAIAFEEADLAYKRHRVDLRAQAQSQPDFLAINPAGKVPVLIDRRHEEPLVITQSNAIMLHVAALAPDQLMPVRNDRERAHFLELFFYFVTDVLGPSFASFQLKNAGDAEGTSILENRTISQIEAAERFLGDGPFMLGERFSLVDIAAVTIASAFASRIDWSGHARLHAWFEIVSSRPAVLEGVSAFNA